VRHLVNYIQPTVCMRRHSGTEEDRSHREAYRIEMAPHNPQSAVSTLGSIHVDATTPFQYHPGVFRRIACRGCGISSADMCWR